MRSRNSVGCPSRNLKVKRDRKHELAKCQLVSHGHISHLISTHPELGCNLQAQYGKRQDGIPAVENLKRQDWLRLPLLYRDKHKQQHRAKAEKGDNGRVRPGQFDSPELDGQK